MRARGQALSQKVELGSPWLDVDARRRRTRELMCRVRRWALHAARRVPGHVDRDEIVSAAYLGLAEALRKLGMQEEASFERYALVRARGAILDYLRSCDLLTRRERAARRIWTKAIRQLTATLGRLPTEEEVETWTGITGRRKCSARPVNVPEQDDLLMVDELPCNDWFSPEALVLARHDAARVRRALSGLPLRMRRVLELFYFHDARLRDIGIALGVTESRACQLRREAIYELRIRLLIEAAERHHTTDAPDQDGYVRDMSRT